MSELSKWFFDWGYLPISVLSFFIGFKWGIRGFIWFLVFYVPFGVLIWMFK